MRQPFPTAATRGAPALGLVGRVTGFTIGHTATPSLGFSFVLHEILYSPDVWQSMLAFNRGVEIGQLAIVLVLWPAFQLFRDMSESTWLMSRRGITALASLISMTWALERIQSVVAVI